MNHEFSGENPIEDTEKTEWDNLGENVPFAENSESPEKEKTGVERFVEDFYGDKTNTIIDNACFDGGERNDPDCYVVSMKLQDYLTDDEQLEAIKCRANGEPLPEELQEKMKQKLSEKIGASKMYGDMLAFDDAYLRWNRVDTLAGRKIEGLTEEDKELQEVLWCADDGFGESEAGKSLLADFDYLKKVYPIGDENVLPMLGKHLQRMVEMGTTDVNELISDPCLRKKHFDSLIDDERGNLEISGELRQLWDADQEFYDSYDYWIQLSDYARRNPDIYERPDEDDIEKLTSEALEQLSEEDIEEVLKNYEKSPRKGDEFLYQKLLPILGLSNNPPALCYGPAKDGEGGYYQRTSHSIVICEDTINKKREDGREVLNTSAFLGFLRSKKLDDKKFYRMNVVAHELWHARQWAGEGVDEEQRAKYQVNFTYYMNAHGCYDSYRSQLIEKEAWDFGTKFEERCRAQYGERSKK